MCPLHKVYHQSQMHSKDSKLTSLERDKKACNDLFHELQKMEGKVATFRYFLSSFGWLSVWLIRAKLTSCIFWHPSHIWRDSTNIEVVAIEHLALLKTRILRSFRALPCVTRLISNSTSNAEQTSSFWPWIIAMSSRLSYPTSTTSRTVTPSTI